MTFNVSPYGVQNSCYGAGMMPPMMGAQMQPGQGLGMESSLAAYTGKPKDDTGFKVGALGLLAAAVATLIVKRKGAEKIIQQGEKLIIKGEEKFVKTVEQAAEKVAEKAPETAKASKKSNGFFSRIMTSVFGSKEEKIAQKISIKQEKRIAAAQKRNAARNPQISSDENPIVLSAKAQSPIEKNIERKIQQNAERNAAKNPQVSSDKNPIVTPPGQAYHEARSKEVADFYNNRPKQASKKKVSHEWQYQTEKLHQEKVQANKAAEAVKKAEEHSKQVNDYYNRPATPGKAKKTHEWQYQAEKLHQEKVQAREAAETAQKATQNAKEQAKEIEAFKHKKVVKNQTTVSQRRESRNVNTQTEAPVTEAEVVAYKKSISKPASGEQRRTIQNIQAQSGSELGNNLPQQTQDKLAALRQELSKSK